MTRRAIDFLTEEGDQEPWLLHLSFIKPHFLMLRLPLYNTMYSSKDIIPAIKSKEELKNTNPLLNISWKGVGKTLLRKLRENCDTNLHGAYFSN